MSNRSKRKGRHLEGGGNDTTKALERLRALRTRELSPGLRRRLLTLAPDVVPELLSLVENEPVKRDDDENERQAWPATHAVDVLCELHPPEAIEPLLRALIRSCECSGAFHGCLEMNLHLFGEALFQPGMELLLSLDDSDIAIRARGSLCAVLAGLHIRDERLLRELLRSLREAPAINAANLVEYGDPAALPELLAAILEIGPVTASTMDLDEPLCAYQDLGGEVTDELAAQAERWFAEADRRREACWAKGELPPYRIALPR